MIKTAKATNQNATLDLNFVELKKAALLLRAVNHKLRQKIILYLHKKGSARVSEIYKHLKEEQSVTSTHLAIMRKNNLVFTQRDGQNIFYSLNYDRIAQLKDAALIFFPERGK